MTPEEQAAEKLKGFVSAEIAKAMEQETNKGKIDPETITAIKNSVEALETKASQTESAVNEILAKSQRLAVDPELKHKDNELFQKLSEGKDLLEQFAAKKAGSVNFTLEKSATTMTVAANTAGLMPRTSWSSTVQEPQFRQLRLRQLFPTMTLPVGFGSHTFARFIKKEGAPAYQTEGAAKAIIDYTVNSTSVTPKTIAGIATVSRQLLRRVDFLSSYIQRHAIEELLNVEDAELLSGAGGSDAIEGILTAAGTYTPSGKVTANSNEWNKLLNSRAQLINLRFPATAILANPINTADMFGTQGTDKTYTYPGLGVTTNGLNIFGIPIIETDIVAVDQFVIGNFSRGSELVMEEALNIRMSEETGDNFAKNLVSIRVEESLLLANIYAAAYLEGSFAVSAL